MLNIALIGGGFITQYYKKAFSELDNVNLVAIADIKENCLAKEVFTVPFYKNYNEMFKEHKEIEVVLVSVGVQDHKNVIIDALKNGKDVLVEKPLSTKHSDLEEIYKVADETKHFVEVIYHFEYGDEALWLKDNIEKFGEIKRYSFSLHEQYANNNTHTVIEEKRSLGNAWEDASINALSDIYMLLDLKEIEKTRDISIFDSNGINIYAHKTFVNSKGQEIDILVDWMTTGKEKISTIDTSKGRIIVDHHEQIIYFNGECVYKNIPDIHRMHIQYLNFFNRYGQSLNKIYKSNMEKTKVLNDVIFM